MVFLDQNPSQKKEAVISLIRADVDQAYMHPIKVHYDPEHGQDVGVLEQAREFSSFIKSIPLEELKKLKISLPAYLNNPSDGWVVVSEPEYYRDLLEIAGAKLVASGFLSAEAAQTETQRTLEEELAHGAVFKDVPGVTVLYGVRFTVEKHTGTNEERRSLDPFCWASGLLETQQEKYLEFMRVGHSATDRLIGDVGQE